MTECSSHDVPANSGRLAKLVMFAIKFVLAGAVVAWLVSSHWKDLVSVVLSFKLQWLALAAALYAFHLFANAWRWWLLLRVQKIDCELSGAVSITMQSFFFSLVIPGGALGGDLVRVGFLSARVPKGRKFDGASPS